MTAVLEDGAVVVEDMAVLVTLPSWCIRWSETVGAWLYYPPAARVVL